MFTISYVVVTKNRINFLKILLDRLLPKLNSDEEVVIVDGDSNDGTKEYLAQLLAQKKIHQLISEPDRNQAHGWNKAFLMARGEIIKKLIDDDVHNLDAIRVCRQFMLANPKFDICISNSMEANLKEPNKVGLESRLPYFRKWKSRDIETFTFGDVTMLIRRTSLSFIGLYDTQFKMIDWEYSLRCTFLNAEIVYYTGYNSLSVSTPGNVSSTATKKLIRYEREIGKAKYGYPGDGSDISTYSRVKIAAGKVYHRVSGKKALALHQNMLQIAELKEHYASYYQQLNDQNMAGNWEFIFEI